MEEKLEFEVIAFEEPFYEALLLLGVIGATYGFVLKFLGGV